MEVAYTMNMKWGVGLVDILVVDAYSEMELCTPIFLGETSSKISRRKNRFEKIWNSKRTHPLTKLNINVGCYVDIYWALVGM
jgi:hypothetical protein